MTPEEWGRVIGGVCFIIGIALLMMLALSLWGCTPGVAKPAAYGVEIQACTDLSHTLCESILCENKVRASYGRPPREAPKECHDP